MGLSPWGSGGSYGSPLDGGWGCVPIQLAAWLGTSQDWCPPSSGRVGVLVLTSYREESKMGLASTVSSWWNMYPKMASASVYVPGREGSSCLLSLQEVLQD